MDNDKITWKTNSGDHKIDLQNDGKRDNDKTEFVWTDKSGKHSVKINKIDVNWKDNQGNHKQ